MKNEFSAKKIRLSNLNLSPLLQTLSNPSAISTKYPKQHSKSKCHLNSVNDILDKISPFAKELEMSFSFAYIY